jgi:hypothetical protein
MYQILSRTSGLVKLSSKGFNYDSTCARMDWDGFIALVETSGSALLAFHDFIIDMPLSQQSPSVFNGFVKLRTLQWNSETTFQVDRSQISLACLVTLESIHIKVYDKSFLEILSLME